MSRFPEDSYCDAVGNCLPRGFGAGISIISYFWSIFSVVLAAKDALQLGSSLESFAYILPHLQLRILVLILVQTFLQTTWLIAFLIFLFGSNLLYMKLDRVSAAVKSRCPDLVGRNLSRLDTTLRPHLALPEHKNLRSSLLVSLPLPVLVTEDLTRKERGEFESEDELRQAEKCLALFSLSNLTVYLGLTYLLVKLITTGLLSTCPNSVINSDQLQQIFHHIILSLAALCCLACLLLLVSPVFTNQKLRKVCLALLTITSLLYPISAGLTLIDNSPSTVFLCSKHRDCLMVFEGKTFSNLNFSVEQPWILIDGKLHNNKDEISLSLDNELTASNSSLAIGFKKEILAEFNFKVYFLVKESKVIDWRKLAQRYNSIIV